MTKLMLIDDDIKDLSRIEEMVRDYYDVEVEIAAFSSSDAALAHWNERGEPDITLLDIIMPVMTGIELAAKLREDEYRGQIIFLTTSNEYAAESYQVNALGYLLKPIKKDALHRLLHAANASPLEDAAFFSVKQNKGLRKVLFRDFLYVEVANHRLFFHLAEGVIVKAYAPLSAYEPVLMRDPRCGRCHKSFILNMDYVERMNGKRLTMRDGREISITRSYTEFQKKYLSWIFAQTPLNDDKSICLGGRN